MLENMSKIFEKGMKINPNFLTPEWIDRELLQREFVGEGLI